jgi:hypothetical protein
MSRYIYIYYIQGYFVKERAGRPFRKFFFQNDANWIGLNDFFFPGVGITNFPLRKIFGHSGVP